MAKAKAEQPESGDETESAYVEKLMKEENIAHFKTMLAEKDKRAKLREEVQKEGQRRLQLAVAS